MGKPGITHRRLRRIWSVWGLYDSVQNAGGMPLTTREAMSRLGCLSTSTVWEALHTLERWGVMHRDPRLARSWHVEIPFNQWLGEDETP